MGNTRNEEQNTRILFRFGLFCEYSDLEYVRIHAIYRVNQAGYAIHIPANAPPEYVNMYFSCRVPGSSTRSGESETVSSGSSLKVLCVPKYFETAFS